MYAHSLASLGKTYDRIEECHIQGRIRFIDIIRVFVHYHNNIRHASMCTVVSDNIVASRLTQFRKPLVHFPAQMLKLPGRIVMCDESIAVEPAAVKIPVFREFYKFRVCYHYLQFSGILCREQGVQHTFQQDSAALIICAGGENVGALGQVQGQRLPERVVSEENWQFLLFLPVT